jgi:DNA-binding NtrC family response regulator
VSPAHRERDVLCASVLVGRPFLVELPATGAVVVGREADADLQLGCGSVSRRHAQLEMRGDHASLTDLGSRNGTFVNGERLEQGSRRVARGDELTFGSARVALFGRSTLPAGARAVLLRSALLARLDADLAGGADVHLVALRARTPWYEIDEILAWLSRLPAAATVGMLSEQALAIASEDPRDLAGLGDDGPEVEVGRAGRSTSGARSAEELVTAALRALIAGHGPVRASPSGRRGAAGPGAPSAPATPAMRAVHEEVRDIAPTMISVLLVGETGVGKEVLARLIHEWSGRGGRLITVNTAALPESLVESELFGHERGAFSGALTAKAGLVEAAHGGTLFLDEIGDLPLPLQAKLLRVLEERAVRRLGATQERKIDVRVIAATHRDLERAVAENAFRRDLLFRLNACTLRIPPLRERAEEIEPLALHLLGSVRGAAPIELSPEALAILRRYPWPGNVRELRNVLERGAALTRGGVLRPEHLPEHVRAPPPPADPPGRTPGSTPAPLGDVRGALADYERQRILDALDQVHGNQSQAAKILGLPRRTLAYKMARLGIRLP